MTGPGEKFIPTAKSQSEQTGEIQIPASENQSGDTQTKSEPSFQERVLDELAGSSSQTRSRPRFFNHSFNGELLALGPPVQEPQKDSITKAWETFDNSLGRTGWNTLQTLINNSVMKKLNSMAVHEG